MRCFNFQRRYIAYLSSGCPFFLQSIYLAAQTIHHCVCVNYESENQRKIGSYRDIGDISRSNHLPAQAFLVPCMHHTHPFPINRTYHVRTKRKKTWFHTHFCLHFILRIKCSVRRIRCLFIYFNSISFLIWYRTVSERRRKKSANLPSRHFKHTLFKSDCCFFLVLWKKVSVFNIIQMLELYFGLFQQKINTITLALDCYLFIPIPCVSLSFSFHPKRAITRHNVTNFHNFTNFHFNNIDHKMCVIIWMCLFEPGFFDITSQTFTRSPGKFISCCCCCCRRCVLMWNVNCTCSSFWFFVFPSSFSCDYVLFLQLSICLNYYGATAFFASINIVKIEYTSIICRFH